ncbi:hypothetical protein DL768_000424 [Monosporascus sp. mg162]|nr:hypothetical protein DL768_000424 [Monosporascus sp. mg162]
MLEKTAASLEPCGLQRVLPCANKPFRSRRQLHTAFWQHGAADVELSGAWQALMHGTCDFNVESTPAAEESRSPALAASTFLLDFLYPSGAVSLMRRLNPIPTERLDNIRSSGSLRRLAPRLYTSSASLSRATGSDPKPRFAGGSAKLEDSTKPLKHATELGGRTEEATQHVQDEALTDFDDLNDVDENVDHVDALDKLLTSSNPEAADQIWYHYKALDPQSGDIYLGQVLVFLSKTGRLSDSWKISELFHRLDPRRWDSYTFVAGVRAEVNLQNNAQALEIFVRGLAHDALDLMALVEALDLLLSQALRSETQEFLSDLWKHYPEMAARWGFEDFEGITSHLKHVASVPGLVEKAINFKESGLGRLVGADTGGIDQDALQVLQKILVRRALVVCTDAQAIPLLELTKDPMAFEEFLRQATPKRRYRLATEVYNVYRELPGSQPSRHVLYEVFRCYTTMNAHTPTKLVGLELLWGDWHKFHTTPSYRAYQKYLAFYASLGDKERVHTLWKEFVDMYADQNVIQGDDTFAHLLQVHAVLGEVEEVQRIFNDISGRFGLKPNAHCWNILLNAYAKVDDYDGAIQTFDRFAAVGKPDKYTYGTIMQMAGSRGDLGFTVDLYGRARRAGILANDAILSALVDAYCQNDLSKEAEDVCVRAAQKGITVTRLWNKLLHYHALRRDLPAVNKILNSMAEKEIPYNQFTYEQLLLALTLCRQSQHALHLLSVALKDKVFPVTTRHFYIVMGALLKTGEPQPVLSLHRMMREHGVPSSSGIIFRLVQALVQFRKFPAKQRIRKTATHWLGDALRSFYQVYGFRFPDALEVRRPGNTRRPQSNERELLKSGSEPFHFGTMIYMFVELKDIVSANELVDLYRYVFQGEHEEVLPVLMLNSVMLADLRENRYDRVKKTWRVLFDAAKKATRSEDFNEDLPHTSKVSPKYRYVLSGGLKIMQEVLFNEKDATGLQNLVEEVRGEGFELDSKNWNYYVQIMVQLKQYKEAFEACEEFLMPNWTGWFIARVRENVKNQLPLDIRRKGTSPRYLRPIATTLYHLAKGYMELDRMSPWSDEAGRTLREIDEECLQAVRAIKSMHRVHSDLEYDIFGDAENPYWMEGEGGGRYEGGNEENEPQRGA